MPSCKDVRDIEEALRVLLNVEKVQAALRHGPTCPPCHSQRMAPMLVMGAYLLTKAIELDDSLVKQITWEENA